MKCRICGNKELKVFLSLGTSPLANSFLSKEDLEKDEPKYPLETAYCDICKLVQLTCVVPPEIMFKDYVYVTSTSNTFRVHFTQLAESLTSYFNLNKDSLVVDIGSNDGLMLKGFQKKGIKVLGVEPATNIAKIALDDGVDTINDFFSSKVVKSIIEKKGKADLVTANNVFAHIDDIDDVMVNVKALLKDDGAFIVEAQYLVDTIGKMTFDNIYHEHISYYSLTSLDYFFKKHGMEIFNVERIDSHGGSIRVFIKKNSGNHKVKESVKELLDYEKKIGIRSFELYEKFAEKVHEVKEKLIKCIKETKSKGNKIAGYGAPAKSTTLLNYCQIGLEFIDYIVDDNPLKVGLYAPGTKIPVVSSINLDDKTPNYILILAWNFAEEIMEKTKKYSDQGVKFIVPLPELKVE